MILINDGVTLTPWCLGALVPWYNWAEAEGGFGSWEGVAAVVSSTIYEKRLW